MLTTHRRRRPNTKFLSYIPPPPPPLSFPFPFPLSLGLLATPSWLFKLDLVVVHKDKFLLAVSWSFRHVAAGNGAGPVAWGFSLDSARCLVTIFWRGALSSPLPILLELDGFSGPKTGCGEFEGERAAFEAPGVGLPLLATSCRAPRTLPLGLLLQCCCLFCGLRL